MNTEKKPGIFRGLVGIIVLSASHIRSRTEKDGQTGQTFFDINLDHDEAGQGLDELDRELHHPRLREFMQEVLGGRKRAWYSVGFASISIIVAAAGVELGPRHGKDIQRLFDILEKHKKGKE